jgi:hypothetical protein
MAKRQASHVLSGNSGLLLSHLEHIADPDGSVTASYNVIAQQLHISLNTAFRSVDRLVRTGYITKVAGAVGSPNGYILLRRAGVALTTCGDDRSAPGLRVGSERA